MTLKQHLAGGMVSEFLRVLLSGAAISLVLGSANALTCHCLYNEQCNSVGNCPYGCARGWYGPGCQLGNLALGKPAYQSSVYKQYTADQAVNGVMPPYGDVTESNCSHTAESTGAALWWYVQLSNSEDFVIKNVTIVNRQGIAARFLRWFYILYTSSESGNPDPSTWTTCYYQASAPSSIQTTFTCTGGTAIGRRVAVFIGNHSEETQMLILCEVYVDGYAYKESSFKDLRISVTPRCDSVQVAFESVPIVPPSSFYVYIRPPDSSSPNRIERIRYPASGAPLAIVPAVPNREYILFVSPETCCFGSNCLGGLSTLPDSRYCVSGTMSDNLFTKTPQYEQYSLVAKENVVNVTARGLYPCKATSFNIQCSQVPRDGLPTKLCYSLSCELNPYYNYTCSLQVTFSDGFKQAYSTPVNIDAADFSAIDINNTTTCDYVDAELRNVAPRWNPNPSFIVFYKKALVDNQTTVVRLPFGKSDIYSVRFAAVEDSEHFVWAAPETCWSKTLCANESDRACFDSAKCAIGRSTTAKFTKVQVRQYSLKLKDCCLSLDDQSPEICERPDYLKMSCLYGENATYESTGIVGNEVCSRPEGVNYSCQIDAGLRNLTVKNTWFMVTITNESLSQCLPRDLPGDLPSTRTQSFIAIIGGAAGGGALLILLIVLAVVLSLRKQKAKAKRKTKKIKANKKYTTNKQENTGVKNEGYEKEEHCSNYEYPEDDNTATKYEESSSQIGVTINDDCEEYYVAYISEPPRSTNTKEAHHTYTTDTHKGIASYSNENKMEHKQPTTEVPEGYADYRLNTQNLSCSTTRKVFQETSGPTVPPFEENDETEESEYVNIQQLQSELGLTQPVGSVHYTNSDTGYESPSAHPSEGISYMNSESPQKKKRKPKVKKSGK